MRPLPSRAGAVALLVAALALIATPASARMTSTVVGTTEVEAHLTEPMEIHSSSACPDDPVRGGDDVLLCEDPSVSENVARLVERTPPGEHIWVGIHSFYSQRIWQAFKTAHENNVNIHVVNLAENDTEGSYSRALADLPGVETVWCDHGNVAEFGLGCISDDPSGRMHAKWMIISRTENSNGEMRPYVTWMSSSNFTDKMNTRFNDSLTFYNNSDVYSGVYWQVWAQMAQEKHWAGNDFFRPGADPPTGTFTFYDPALTATAYLSPEAQTDLVVRTLDSISPSGSTCKIWLLEAMITGSRPPGPNDPSGSDAVVEKLYRLGKAGCELNVVVNWKDSGESASAAEARARLREAGATIRRVKYVHNKAILIQSTFNGVHDRLVLLAGSHNLSKSALRRNDELLLRVLDNSALWGAYYWHYQAAASITDPSRYRAG